MSTCIAHPLLKVQLSSTELLAFLSGTWDATPSHMTCLGSGTRFLPRLQVLASPQYFLPLYPLYLVRQRSFTFAPNYLQLPAPFFFYVSYHNSKPHPHLKTSSCLFAYMHIALLSGVRAPAMTCRSDGGGLYALLPLLSWWPGTQSPSSPSHSVPQKSCWCRKGDAHGSRSGFAPWPPVVVWAEPSCG